MKIITLIISSLFSALASPHVESGTLRNPHWNESPLHILQSEKTPDRYIDYPLRFQHYFQFDKKINIAIANFQIDLQQGQPNGYLAEVLNIQPEGFTLRIAALTNRQVYTIFTNWFATDDPNFHVQYHTFYNLTDKIIANQLGLRELILSLEVSDWTYKQANYQGVSFLKGIKSLSKPYALLQSVKDINYKTNQVHLAIRLGSTAKIETLSVCLVLAQGPEYFIGLPTLGFRVPDNKHAWVTRHPADSEVKIDLPTLRPFQVGYLVPIYGITGFEAWDNANIRMRVNCEVYGNPNCVLTTWWDSKQLEMDFNIIIYKDLTSKVNQDSECFLDSARRIPCPQS